MPHYLANNQKSARDRDKNADLGQVVFVPLVSWTDHEFYYPKRSQQKYLDKAPLFPCLQEITPDGRAFQFQVSQGAEANTELDNDDILFCDKVDYETERLVPLQLYVLVMAEGFLCRRFFKENRHFEFRSDDPSGYHLILSTNLISEIWEVKSILKRKIPAPHALRNELNANSTFTA